MLGRTVTWMCWSNSQPTYLWPSMKLRYSSLIAEAEVKLYFALKQADLHNYTKAHYIRIFVMPQPHQAYHRCRCFLWQSTITSSACGTRTAWWRQEKRGKREIDQKQKWSRGKKLCCTQTTCPTLPAVTWGKWWRIDNASHAACLMRRAGEGAVLLQRRSKIYFLNCTVCSLHIVTYSSKKSHKVSFSMKWRLNGHIVRPERNVTNQRESKSHTTSFHWKCRPSQKEDSAKQKGSGKEELEIDKSNVLILGPTG